MVGVIASRVGVLLGFLYRCCADFDFDFDYCRFLRVAASWFIANMFSFYRFLGVVSLFFAVMFSFLRFRTWCLKASYQLIRSSSFIFRHLLMNSLVYSVIWGSYRIGTVMILLSSSI